MSRGKFAQSLTGDVTEPMIEAAAGVPDPLGSTPFLLSSGYGAANNSNARGYLYWPNAKTRFELTALSAEEIRRRIHWLLANFGFARRLVWGMAQAAGSIMPMADTDDPEWDELVDENWMDRVTSKEIFDIAGKFDFFSVQNQIEVDAFKDGDMLTIPTSPEGYNGLQFAFFEGSQISQYGGNFAARTTTLGPEWIDGVKTDDHGKHQAYRFQSGNDLSNYVEIDAANAYYYGNLDSHHAVRGISILTAAVLNMVDVVQTRGFVKKRIKEASNLRPVIERDAPTVLASNGGMGGKIIQGALPVPGSDGKQEQTFNWEVVDGAGGSPDLQPGEKLRLVADDRPGPNQQDFEDTLLRDCSYAANLPHEALFAMKDLKGPSQRYVMAQLKRWVENRFRQKSGWVRWVRALHIANEIEAGRLPRPKNDPKKPLWWLKAAYIGQSAMTIDEGRLGNLALVNLQSGLTTWAKEWGHQGYFWKQGIRQRVKEYAFAEAEAAKEGCTAEQVFPGLVVPESHAPAGKEPDKKTTKS